MISRLQSKPVCRSRMLHICSENEVVNHYWKHGDELTSWHFVAGNWKIKKILKRLRKLTSGESERGCSKGYGIILLRIVPKIRKNFGLSDEDITSKDKTTTTSSTPSLPRALMSNVQGPITRERARQHNHQVLAYKATRASKLVSKTNDVSNWSCDYRISLTTLQ